MRSAYCGSQPRGQDPLRGHEINLTGLEMISRKEKKRNNNFCNNRLRVVRTD